MIEIRKADINSYDATILLQELNEALVLITGNDGTSHFSLSEDMIFVIGYIDGKAYGCGALREYCEDCGEIKRIYSRKNNLGLGCLIIDYLKKEAIKKRYRRLILETRIQNQHAISFYEKYGFEKCDKYGVYVDKENAYCMQMNI